MATTRRAFLRSAAGAAVVIGIGSQVMVETALAADRAEQGNSRPKGKPAARSENGWFTDTAPNTGGTVWTRPVPGTEFDVDLAIGDAEIILIHVIRRFHYEVDSLRPGDVTGFRPVAKSRGYKTNYASGTAVSIRPGTYPAGVKGGFFPHELEVVRDILADCDGVVKWGGDFATPDESHFQIDLPPSDVRVRRLANKVRGWKESPGAGAGVIQDPRDSKRREAAQKLAREQAD
ncbi:hypothetical protein LUX12_10065 [Streptomyces somaliensis]|uniref:hypothetical protein n=1 Tax=Streptomyces somaliensis TaxID=78355 RepID=UPI0020CBF600|nr:hypothetical protein [Streptomyces somaliensis]MCP9945049.1 hypothetical protein [Streptomyces somaliensis]MCP9961736.1 hypothetical protein [Streptomyces somaliensis]MCP9974551.1 hypothetical protein [Streptomyces somaliensis]